ncbi:MAG: protein kinase [Acidobacteriota bacterium]
MKLPRSLGRYEIVDLISEGGMGALYRARDPRIGRYVAIKLLRRGYDAPELRDRFSREAIAAGSLSHPNIVTIYDVGEEDGLPFIAMEYVRGETFSDLLGLRPPLSVLRKVQLTEEVCAGLAHAHEAGIVHRDIKPANLIVGPEGTVKILDFGIARLSASGMTLPGAILGTLNYMSPEQVAGTAVDGRADIFAVGAVLYELLSHQQAFPGRAHDEVLQRILHGAPRPITEYCPDLDPRLVRLIDRALEKDPDRRFQEIVSLQRELADIRLGPPRAERRVAAPPRAVSNDAQAAVMTPPPAPARGSQTPNPADRDPFESPAKRLEEYLAAADQALDVGDYDAAIEWCTQVLVLDASDARALSTIGRIHAARDEHQIQTHIAEARAQLSRGAMELAQQSLDAAHRLSPGHPEIARARDEVLAEQARILASTVRTAIERALREYEGGDLTAALSDLHQALALDPQNAEAKALEVSVETAIARAREEARLRDAVNDARRRFLKGEHLAALQSLEALQPASSAVVAGTLEELRLAYREIEEQRRVEKARIEQRRRIEGLLDEAQAALAANRLDDAWQLLARVREIDPTVAELPDLTERVRRAEAVERLKADLDRALGDFEERMVQGDLPGAGDRLAAATSLAPADSRVAAARTRLQQAAAALAAKEAAEARRRQGEQKLDDAAARLEAGDLAGAADLLKLAAELTPTHPRAAELSERLQTAVNRQAAAEAAERLRQQVAALIHGASGRLQSAADRTSDLALALREVNQALTLDPENAEAASLKTAIDISIAERREATRVQAVINNARRRFANGKHQAALRLLEEFQPSSTPEIAAAWSELRGALLEIEERQRAERERIEKDARIAGLLAEARTALRDNQFDAALGLLSRVSEIDVSTPQLQPLIERVGQAQAAARRGMELDRLLAGLDEGVRRGDLSAARDFLVAATALSPGDARVPFARQRVEQAVAAREADDARARDLEERHATAEALLERGDLPGAKQWLAVAAGLGAKDPRFLLLSERVERAIKTRDEADAAARLSRSVDELLAAAAEHLQQGEHSGTGPRLAMLKIAHALAMAPGHARAEGLKAMAENALAAQRETARIRVVIGNARSRFANGKHQAALQLLEDLDPLSHPLVADTLKELRDALHDIQERRRAEHELAARQRVDQTTTTPSAQVPQQRTAGGHQVVEDGMEENEEGTTLVQMRAADTSPRGANTSELTSIALREMEHSTEELTPANDQPAGRMERRMEPVAPIAHPWRWGLLVLVGVLLLVIVAALLRAR